MGEGEARVREGRWVGVMWMLCVMRAHEIGDMSDGEAQGERRMTRHLVRPRRSG